MNNPLLKIDLPIYELSFGESSLTISTTSYEEFLKHFSSMKNQLIDTFKNNSHELLFANARDFSTMGACYSEIINYVDELNFSINIFNQRTSNLVVKVDINFGVNPFEKILSLSEFLSAFFEIYFSNRYATKDMLERFTLYGNLSVNNDVLILDRDSSISYEKLAKKLGFYDLEVVYSYYSIDPTKQTFLVNHRTNDERKEFLDYLLHRKSTHLISVKPIKNQLLYSFENKI